MSTSNILLARLRATSALSSACGHRRAASALLTATAVASALAFTTLSPSPARASDQPVTNVDVSRVVSVHGANGSAVFSGETGNAGQSVNGWAVGQPTGEFILSTDSAPTVLVDSVGGNGGTAGEGANYQGGQGGNAGNLSYTNVVPTSNDDRAFIINQGSNDALRLVTTGGNGGKGSDAANGGTGGQGGAAGAAGDITLTMISFDNTGVFDVVGTAQQNSTGINLLSTGGNGGAAGQSSSKIETQKGTTGADGAKGGDIRATIGLDLHSDNKGSGISAISKGGDGGTGGDTSTAGSSYGGAGGDGAIGGLAQIEQTGGTIYAYGTDLTDSTSVDGENGTTAPAQISRITTGIFAESRGGAGGMGAGANGAITHGGGGGAAGQGGSASILLSDELIANGSVQTSVHTFGSNAIALLAQSIGGSGGDTSDVGGAFSKTGGTGGIGGNAGPASIFMGQFFGGKYDLVITEGAQSDAVVAQSIGGGGGYGGSVNGGGLFYTVETGGKGANGGDGQQAVIANGYWQVDGQGNNDLLDPYVIQTKGLNSFGLLAQSVGGGGGRGGDAIGINLGPRSNVVGGSGGTGGGGGSVYSTNYGIIQTAGDQSIGVFAQSIGGGGGAGGSATSVDVGSILTTAYALGGEGGVGGDGGDATLANFGQVITGGANATAVFGQSVGGGGGNGGSSLASTFALNPPDVPTVTVTSAIGGIGGAGGAAQDVTLYNTGLIATQGANSFGVLAQSVGGGGGSGGDATAASQAYNQSKLTITDAIGGNGGGGGGGGTVTVANSGLIQTLAYGSVGVFAQSVGGGGGNGGFGETNQGAYNAGGDYSTEITVGIGGSGGKAGDGGAVNVYNYIDDKNVTDRASYFATNLNGTGGIVTLGLSAPGIFAQSVGGGGGNGGDAIGKGGNGQISVNVAVGGNGGAGGAGGDIMVNNGAGAIATFGANSPGVFAQSIGGGGGNGGNATTGSGNDPQYSYPEFLADQLAPKLGNSNVQNIADGLWDWKDNVQSAFSDVDRLKQIYAAYNSINPAKALSEGNGLKVTDLTVDIGAGFGGSGGAAGKGGDVSLYNSGQVLTSGPGSSGLLGQSVGGGGGTGGASTASTVNDKLPVSVIQGAIALGGRGGSSGNGGTVNIANYAGATIETDSDMSHGMFAQSIGGGGGIGGASTTNSGISGSISLTLGGDRSTEGGGGLASLYNSGQITTKGNDSVGMIAQSIGGGGGYASLTGQVYDPQTGFSYSATQVLQAGSGSIKPSFSESGKGSAGGPVQVYLDTGSGISTTGINSYGVLAQSIGGGGGVIITDPVNGVRADNGSLFPNEGSSHSVDRNDGGTVTVTALTTITTSGAGAAGILAQSIGGGGGIVNGLNGADFTRFSGDFNSINGIQFVGDGQHGTGDGGSVEVMSNANITTTGAYAHGIFAQSASSGGGIVGWGGNSSGNGAVFWGGGTYDRSCDTSGRCSGTVDVNLSGGTVTVSGAHAYGIFAMAEDTVRSGAGVSIEIASGAKVIANGSAAAGILIEGGVSEASAGPSGSFTNGHAIISNQGLIDASGSTAKVAITGLGRTPYTVNNQGTIRGSVLAGGTVQGNQPIVTFNNAAGGVFEAGPIVDLGGGKLTNAGVVQVGGAGTISTTTLTGDLEQVAGGVLHVDADLTTGAADKLMVNGKVVLGGTVEVAPVTVSNKALTVISATGGITLNQQLQLVDNSALFDFPVVVSGNSLQIRPVANFTSAAGGLGKSQQAVAGNLQTLFDSGASMDQGFTALSKVGSANIAGAFDKLGGQALGAINAFRYAASRVFVGNLYSGCSTTDGRDGSVCGWGKFQTVSGTQGQTSDEFGYKVDAQVYQLGLQKELGATLDLSVAGGYEHGTFRDADGDAHARGSSLLAGMSLRYHQGPFELVGAVDGNRGWYTSTRTIIVGDNNSTARGHPKEWEVGAHVRADYAFELSRDTYFKPLANLHIVYVHADQFSETGSSPFNLDVADQGEWAVTGDVGAEVGGAVHVGGDWSLRPFASAALEFNGADDWNSHARFADQPQSDRFSVTTGAPDRLGRYTIGANLIGSQKVDISLSYSRESGDHYHSDTGVARIAYRF